MASGMFLELDTRHLAVVNGLGPILVLPIARVRPLRLQKQGAITLSPSRACYLAHLRLDLCSKGSCPKNKYNFGTASYRGPKWRLCSAKR